MANHGLPSVEILRQLFRYDPETGRLTWRDGATNTGTRRTKGYHQINIRGKSFLVHRVAWAMCHGKWPEGNVDHINGDPMDNRIANLRDCSQSENVKNSRKRSNNKSGVTGVTWDAKNQKWHATIRSNYKTINLGRYRTIEEATSVRSQANKRLGFTERHGL